MMTIEEIRAKWEGVKDYRELYLHELGEMLNCAMEHIERLEAENSRLRYQLNFITSRTDAIKYNKVLQESVE